MVHVTFPDGARREFPQGITGLDIAKGISPSLAKRSVAMTLDGELAGSPQRNIPAKPSRSSRHKSCAANFRTGSSKN